MSDESALSAGTAQALLAEARRESASLDQAWVRDVRSADKTRLIALLDTLANALEAALKREAFLVGLLNRLGEERSEPRR